MTAASLTAPTPQDARVMGFPSFVAISSEERRLRRRQRRPPRRAPGTPRFGVSAPRAPHRSTVQATPTNPRTNHTANVTTVSYTHLRAHETVLDLVCRL